jgi:hypothetical protein
MSQIAGFHGLWISAEIEDCADGGSLGCTKRPGPFDVHGVVADFGEAEQAFSLGDKIRQFLCKLRVVPDGFDEVQQLLAPQIFPRVAKSKLLLYVQRGLALFNPSVMKCYG